MAKKLLFTSLKGGTGVTTCCVRLSLALAELGERVLMLDGDNLSGGGLCAAGCENLQVYTLADYAEGACRAKQAAVNHPYAANFCIMPTLGLKDLTAAERAVNEVEGLFDIIIADKTARKACDCAVIVTEPFTPSLKSADVCKSLLADGGIEDISLIVNKLNGGQVLGGEVVCAEEAAALLKLPLLCVIPEDLTLSAGNIRPSTQKAFTAAAEALLGRREGVTNVLKPYFGVHGYIKRKLRERI